MFSLLRLLNPSFSNEVHPLRLSLCEIEYSSQNQLLTANLKLFLTDVNEAIVFDPYSKELAFCQSNESPKAEQLLLEYLNEFFHIKLTNSILELKIKSNKLSGEGENTALWIYFEHEVSSPLKSMDVKNAVFTDLFFDQNNIVYIHIDEESNSLMLNKKTPSHLLKF